jgi:hypothetical protein
VLYRIYRPWKSEVASLQAIMVRRLVRRPSGCGSVLYKAFSSRTCQLAVWRVSSHHHMHAEPGKGGWLTIAIGRSKRLCKAAPVLASRCSTPHQDLDCNQNQVLVAQSRMKLGRRVSPTHQTNDGVPNTVNQDIYYFTAPSLACIVSDRSISTFTVGRTTRFYAQG